MSRLRLFCLLACVGCGEPPRETSVAPAPSPTAPSPAPDPTSDPPASDPPAAPGLPGLEGLEGLDDPGPDLVAPPDVEVSTTLPESGCVVTGAPVRALDGADRPAIVRGVGTYFVAGYVRSGAGEAVAIARLDDGASPRLFVTLPIAHGVAEGARRGAPALSVAADGRLLVAATDADGALLYADLETESVAVAGTLRIVAGTAHADARFAPAVVATAGATVIAWTDGSGTPMRVRLARVDRTGGLLGTNDVTPAAGGAAAPTIGRGDTSPTLYFVDPRISISVVSSVVLGTDGTPGETTVVRPLARAADPASFVAVHAGGAVHLAYVAVGNAGSRAVGLLDAEGSAPPVALVPGLGFGASILVDGVTLGDAAVLVAEAPSAAEPTAPHEVRVRVLAASGALSEPLILPGATEPSIAAGGGSEVVVATLGGYVTRLGCR